MNVTGSSVGMTVTGSLVRPCAESAVQPPMRPTRCVFEVLVHEAAVLVCTQEPCSLATRIQSKGNHARKSTINRSLQGNQHHTQRARLLRVSISRTSSGVSKSTPCAQPVMCRLPCWLDSHSLKHHFSTQRNGQDSTADQAPQLALSGAAEPAQHSWQSTANFLPADTRTYHQDSAWHCQQLQPLNAATGQHMKAVRAIAQCSTAATHTDVR